MASTLPSQQALSAASDTHLPPESKIFPFLRLPPEIRNQIYHKLLVKPGPQAIGELPMSYPAEDFFKSCDVDSDTASDATLFADIQRYRQSPFTGACRLLHSEAAPVFYSSNAFSFTNGSTLYAFLRNLTTLSRISLQKVHFSALEEFLSADLMAALIYLQTLCPGMRKLEVVYRQLDIPQTGNLCRDFAIHDALGWLRRLPSYEERIGDQQTLLQNDHRSKRERERYRTCEGLHSSEVGLYPVFEPPIVSVQPWSGNQALEMSKLSGRLRGELPWDRAASKKFQTQHLFARAREGGEMVLLEVESSAKGEVGGFEAVLEKIDVYRQKYQLRRPPNTGYIAYTYPAPPRPPS